MAGYENTGNKQSVISVETQKTTKPDQYDLKGDEIKVISAESGSIGFILFKSMWAFGCIIGPLFGFFLLRSEGAVLTQEQQYVFITFLVLGIILLLLLLFPVMFSLFAGSLEGESGTVLGYTGTNIRLNGTTFLNCIVELSNGEKIIYNTYNFKHILGEPGDKVVVKHIGKFYKVTKGVYL